MMAQYALAESLRRDGLDWHPERLARAMICYQENTDPEREP